jgi:hypothetical protein
MVTTIAYVQLLLSRYVGQLVSGCGDARCTESQCLTGRINTAKQPERRLTHRAARAIAFTICNGPMPESHICFYYDRTEQHPIPETEVDRDPSSIVQQLIDTPSVSLNIDSPYSTSQSRADGEVGKRNALSES